MADDEFERRLRDHYRGEATRIGPPDLLVRRVLSTTVANTTPAVRRGWRLPRWQLTLAAGLAGGAVVLAGAAVALHAPPEPAPSQAGSGLTLTSVVPPGSVDPAARLPLSGRLVRPERRSRWLAVELTAAGRQRRFDFLAEPDGSFHHVFQVPPETVGPFQLRVCVRSGPACSEPLRYEVVAAPSASPAPVTSGAPVPTTPPPSPSWSGPNGDWRRPSQRPGGIPHPKPSLPRPPEGWPGQPTPSKWPRPVHR